MFEEKRHEFEIEGVKASFSTGLLARKSESAVFAQLGETSILATVNTAPASSDADFFPMSVEYMEKLYAAGKISGSKFVKRDRFPSDDAVIKARIIDRSFRPRFPKDYRDQVSIIVKILSFDPKFDPMILGINAVSAALMTSSAPFDAPISGVRVGMDDNGFTAYNKHVDRDEIDESELNLVIAGDGEKLTNIDSNAFEVPDDKVIEAMEYGLDLMNPWLDAQKEFVSMFDEEETKAAEYTSFAIPEDLKTKAEGKYYDKIEEVISKPKYDKAEKEALIEEMTEEISGEHSKKQVSEAFEEIAKEVTRKIVLEEDRRIDGRELDEMRPLDTQVDLLPRTHGSGLFTRGMTQVLTIATLGSSRSKMLIDDMTGEDTRRYMHYYVEAPFSFGEAGRVRYIPGRRAVGHGILAEKALLPVLPSAEEFPYTIILMSEVMSEEGSSSMASACGSTLALMHAGVPISKPVAGIATGLIIDEEDEDNYKILTDIQGIEDFYGYMDFKVTGTRDGVTAIQMDTKAKGLPLKVFADAIKQSKEARLKILDEIESTIEKPNSELSDYAPQVATMKIPVDKIGELIGPGGKNIKNITEETGADVDIDDDGSVNIFAETKEDMAKAKQMVEDLVFVPEVGEVYEGVVATITDYGAFVDLKPNVAGLVHVSEISDTFVKDVNEHMSEGDKVKVKVIGIDDEGKIKLSMKGIEQ